MPVLDIAWPELRVFLLNDRKMSDKSSSVYALKSRFKKLSGFFQDKDFNRLNFTSFISWLKDHKYSASYINNFIKLAKSLERYLQLFQGRNRELDDYTYFRENKQWLGETLSPEEIKQLAEVNIPYGKYSDTINNRNQVLILLLGTTGCRVGEALDLIFDDVRGEPPFLVFRDTKNGDNRPVPITRSLYEAILGLTRHGMYIFVSARTGHKLNIPEINSDLKKRASACGIKKRVFCHQFRHSYISTMRECGVDILDIAKLVGHRNLATTMRYSHSNIEYYANVILTHPLIRQGMTAQQKMNRILGKLKADGDIVATKLEENTLSLTINLK